MWGIAGGTGNGKGGEGNFVKVRQNEVLPERAKRFTGGYVRNFDGALKIESTETPL